MPGHNNADGWINSGQKSQLFWRFPDRDTLATHGGRCMTYPVKKLHSPLVPRIVPLEESGLRVTVEEVTPEIASYWLEHFNLKNRNIIPGQVQRLSSDISRGRWVASVNCIVFDDVGTIVNGQHSLSACVHAGIPIQVIVIRGAPGESRLVEGTGAKKTLGDYLQMQGESRSTALAGAVMFGSRWSGGRILWSTAILTKQDGAEWLERNPGIRTALKDAAVWTKSLRVPESVGAAFIHRARLAEPKALKTFYMSLANGSSLAEGNPILALRNWLIVQQGMRKRRGVRAPAPWFLAAFIKAWNSWILGQSRITVAWRRGNVGESFPVMLDSEANAVEMIDEVDMEKSDDGCGVSEGATTG